MRKVQKIDELKGLLADARKQYSSLGLVPTMGALHEGHFVLLEQCKRENDFTIATIFVNPLQFNDPEDYQNYPRRLEEDLYELERRGCDLVFFPSEQEVYPEKPVVTIQFGEMERVLEGHFRPGHFQGVGLVLAKFFNLLQPDRAYFGLKDLQQFLLVKRLAQDLAAKERIASERPPQDIVKDLREFYGRVDGLEIEYVELVEASNLRPLHAYDDVADLALCVAAYVEEVRLIDNLYLQLDAAKT